MPDTKVQYLPFASISYRRFGMTRLTMGYRVVTGDDERLQDTVYLAKGLYRSKKAEALFDGWTDFMYHSLG